MRLKFIIVIAALGAGLAGPAAAQMYDPNYPVCMEVYEGRLTPEYVDCSFTSLPQCQATASGRSASCSVNPFYKGAKKPTKERGQRYRQPGN
ncbi:MULTISPECIES: DUF3551 domain-containing protein [Bradyrhizobium]|uniref:DUF3551 domain-containing protein n=1 Tax=Bradyrhizobium elkanii TaxID=29448 RepID=UPI0027150E8B|nr:DUF3551 domain-containing protein [Bradyrhizobium elkanii]WLA51011.1 DUF3551 domain-containing protein [Bradyrhizobium elkanii]WLB78712.1 DUF3551 domain-containing protein [Bradyrhizobium elkanii]